MSLIDGLSQHTWENQTLYAYKLSENEHLGLVSLPWGQVQNISNFMNVTEDDKGNTIKVNFVLNCHYFDMAGGTNGYLGRCQSFTADARTLGVGEDGFDGYDGGTDKPYTDLVILNDGTIKYGDFNSWDYPKSEVILGVAPAGVELDNGEDKNWFSPACGYGKISNANTQSLLLKMDDGRFALVAVTGSLSPLACRDWTKSVGGTHQSCYDSGGSTQAIVRNSDGTTETIRNTSRKIPTAFVAYEIISEDEGGSSEPEGGTTPPENTDPVVPENPDPIIPENPSVEEEITGSLVHDRINKIKNEKENIKTVLINKGIVMENIPFTEYHNKINELSSSGNIPASINAIHNVSWEGKELSVVNTYASEIFDSGNNNKKGVYLCIRNASAATVYGSNDQSDWQTIINSNTGGSNSGSTGTPKNKVSEAVDFRYFKASGTGYNNGNSVIVAWGIFEATGSGGAVESGRKYIYNEGTIADGYEFTAREITGSVTFDSKYISLGKETYLGWALKDEDLDKNIFIEIELLDYKNPSTETPELYHSRAYLAYQTAAVTSSEAGTLTAAVQLIPTDANHISEHNIVGINAKEKYCKIFSGPNKTLKVHKIWAEDPNSSEGGNEIVKQPSKKTQTLSATWGGSTESGSKNSTVSLTFNELSKIDGIEQITNSENGSRGGGVVGLSIDGNILSITGNNNSNGVHDSVTTCLFTAYELIYD